MTTDPGRRALLRVEHALFLREQEALRLFEPQPQQEPIFRSKARRLLIRGGNRAGKTLCGAVRVADWICGNTRFLRRKADVKVLCVSLDFSLMSENIYRKLFEPGAFFVCGKCHRVRHACDCGDWTPMDAPPLVPPRLVKEFAWLDKRRGIPAKCWLKTGATLDFRSTDQGRATFQGIPWDFAWCDEEATNDEDIMNEIERGLIDRKGSAQITATPLAASLTLVNWSERAGEEKAENDLRERDGLVAKDLFYGEVQLFTDDNQALSSDEIERFFEHMSEEEEGVRRRGEFLVQQGLVYGREFDKKVHIIDTRRIPLEWTLYEVQDPGHTHAFATLYWAVDPDGDNYIVDEVYLKRKDIPDVVAAQIRLVRGGSRALSGHHKPQRSIIDPAANQSGVGRKGKTIRRLIHEERLRQGHFCWEGEHKTFKAHNEVRAGIFAVKALLKPRENGRPRLFVMRHCHHLLREIRRYRWPTPKSGIPHPEKAGPLKKDDDAMDCLRYGALAGLEYVPPDTRPGWGTNPRLRDAIRKILKERREKRIRKSRDGFTLGAGHA